MVCMFKKCQSDRVQCKKSVLGAAGLLSILLFGGSFEAQAGNPSAESKKPLGSKLSPYLKELLSQESLADPILERSSPSRRAREQTTPVRVYFRETADLKNRPVVLIDKREKGRWVYESLRQVATRSQEKVRAFLGERGVDFETFYIVNMIVIPKATKEVISELERFAEIDRILVDEPFAMVPPAILESEENTKTMRGIEAAVAATGAPEVWETYNARGQGVVVAGQDTGVDFEHPALKKQYRGYKTEGQVAHDYSWYDAVDKTLQSGKNPCGLSSAIPCDDDTHGTHTMGTVVGDDGALEKIGMAPEAKWIACRNMDRGLGQPSTYIRCFEFFLAPFPLNGSRELEGRPDLAPDVINNSWGCPQEEGCDGEEMRSVLEALTAAGISTVVSAGNAGPGCATINDQPATHSALTLTVGAYNHRNQQIASFSSRGPSTLDKKIGPDIVAPGVGIRSSVPGGGYAGGYNGTSMAGPHVAGAVALLISQVPELRGQPEKITEILTKTATPMTSTQTCGGLSGTQIPNNTFGYGLLNIKKAVDEALQPAISD